MFPRKNRLKKKKDFERVLIKGNLLKTDFLLMKYLNNSIEEDRFGFVISSKKWPKATQRNKLKRRLTEATRSIFKNLKTKRDYLLIALKGFENLSYREILERVNLFYQKLLKKDG